MSQSYRSNPVRLFLKAIPLLRQFRKAENFSRDQLEKFQFDKLKHILAYAERFVPYYRNLFADIGFQSGDFKCLADLTGIPYLTKDILKNSNLSDFISDEANKLSTITKKTSGSTGTPLEFALDLRVRAAKYAITYHVMSQAGYRLGQAQFEIENFGYDGEALIFSRLVNKTSLHAYTNIKDNAQKCYEILSKHPPRHILTFPNSLLELLKYIPHANSVFNKLRGITSIAEPLTESIRTQIKHHLDVPLLDFYSNSESSFVAYETQDRGYLFAEQFSYPEIIPVDNCPLTGELVTTTFYSYAMPLIRYCNADIVQLEEPAEHKCSFRRVKNIQGRTSEAIIHPNGSKVTIFNFLNSALENISQYQLEQTDATQLVVNVVLKKPDKPINIQAIIDELKYYVGADFKIQVQAVKQLKRNRSGKTPRVINSFKA